MAFPADITTTTPAKYRFVLQSDTESIVCNPHPIEWRSGTLEFKRDLECGGVFSSFHVETLTFLGNGAEMLKKLFEKYEVNAKCTLIVYWWKRSTRSYVEFPSHFDINFNFYEKTKVGKFHFGVRVKAINSSVQTKLDNRQEVNVDITKLKSVGGFEIKDYSNLRKELNYSATNIYYQAKLSRPYSGVGLEHRSEAISYTAIPLDIEGVSDFSEVQNVKYATKSISLLGVGSFFKSAKYDYSFDIAYDIQTRVTQRHIGSFPWTIQIIETNSAGVAVNVTDIAGFGGENRTYTFTGTTTVALSKGNDLKLVVKVEQIGGTTAYLNYGNITITSSVTASPATTTEGFPIYEAVERVCQKILDTQYPFYSEFFGRTDIAYDASGNKYNSESQLRFSHLQSGLNQRGVKLSNNPLAINFKDLFKSLRVLYNVGYSIEKNLSLFGDENLRIRIEEYAYFFKNTLTLDLSDRVNEYDISSQVMPELVPVDIKFGFDNYEYLSVNGRGEPNTTNERTTIMNTSTKLECISPFRGDTKGIMDNLSNPVTSEEGSQDTKGESDIYMVKTQKDIKSVSVARVDQVTINSNTGDRLIGCNGYYYPMKWNINTSSTIDQFLSLYRYKFGAVALLKTSNTTFTFTANVAGVDFKERATIEGGGSAVNLIPNARVNADYTWAPEKGENITIEDDSSLFRDDLLNRYFTPSRMLLRSGSRIKSGMTKFISSLLTFQKSDKWNSLKTTGEGYTITESDDISVASLPDPIYKPMKHVVIFDFMFSDLEAIQANPFGYIKLSDTISGYLLGLKKKNDEAKAEISIIEKY